MIGWIVVKDRPSGVFRVAMLDNQMPELKLSEFGEYDWPKEDTIRRLFTERRLAAKK